MADWFETRFREPVDGGPLDPAFVARIRALAVEQWQAEAGTTPPDLTDADDREGDIVVLESDGRRTGGEPANPRRRLPRQWLLAAAVAAIVAVGSTLFVATAANDEENQVDTAAPASPMRNVMELSPFADLEPGTYWIDPDGDPSTPLRVTYQVVDEGWSQWLGAVKFNEVQHTVISITTVDNLVTHACTDHGWADPPVGSRVEDLATALAELEPFEVSAAPSDVTIFGYEGKHLQLTVPQLEIRGSGDDAEFADCWSGNLESWISENGGGAFYGYGAEPGRTEDFWILDVDGERLVVATTVGPSSPPEHVAEMQTIFDSIRIEP